MSEKYSINQTSFDFLKKYINNPAPVGYESEGQKIWKEYISSYVDEVQIDTYGSMVGVVNPAASYKVVIEAHADEISWYVNYISEEGFIYVIRNGGSDHQIAPSKKVCIHSENGKVEGVFGWPAIHTRKPSEEKSPSLETIFVDVGAASKKEVEEMGIHIGSVITYPDEFFVLNEKYYVGRALDNRIGGFMIAEVAKLIKQRGQSLPFGLYIVNAVQEEVGLRGAEMIANRIKPNVAIVTDVCHDSSTPMIDKKIQGDIKCGLGPVISYAPAVQNKLRELIINTAMEQKIEFQRLASSRFTGTDTDAFAYSNEGVASALVSLPLRYMHTTVEMTQKKDIESVVELIFQALLKIETGEDFRYL